MKVVGLFSALLALGLWGKIKKQLPESDRQITKAGGIIFCSPSLDTLLSANDNAPLLKGIGNLQYPVTTGSPLAQQYFNQGLSLMYGFNHGEAARSFRTAIRLDSTCAMAYWGLAMVMGPNYNAALNPASLTEINATIYLALKYSLKAAENEQSLILALSKRFPAASQEEDINPYYVAYMNAMKQAHEAFPADIEIAVLYADAMMNMHPWNLWLKDGTPQSWTPEIIALLEKTLAAAPDHPGAIHYYIHATEASRQADKALSYAEKLPSIMPSAGHIVHMPSHTYIRTGHYHKGVLVNELASKADSSYIAQCKVQGMYPLVYYPHNIHFLAACAFLEGNSKKAMDAAWMVSRKADKRYLAEYAGVQHFSIIPYYVMVHLAKWDQILEQPKPGESLLYPVAIWHYARGMAFAAKGDMPSAENELAGLKETAGKELLQKLKIWEMNSAADLVNIAVYTLEGELNGYKKQYDAASACFKKAVAIEDSLSYMEPPDWFFSVRHTWGHWLLQAKRYSEAENVYRRDLETFKENGWALMGLYQSLKGQQQDAEARRVKKRFKEAWKWSDIALNSSRVFN